MGISFRQRRHQPPEISQKLTMRLAMLILAGVLLIELRSILIPVVLAGLLSFLLIPLVNGLTRWGLSSHMAILIAELAATLPFLGMIVILAATVEPLNAALPKYQQGLTRQIYQSVDTLLGQLESEDQRLKIREALGRNLLPKVMNEGVQFAQKSLKTVTTTLGYFFLTMLLSLFMLLESRRFKEKLIEAFGPDYPILTSMEGIGRDVRAYIVAKTAISVFTGLCVWGFLAMLDVDFAAFWGLLAIPLNFIPTVGAIVASFPPIAVVLVDPQLSTWTAMGVTLGLLVINGLIGSVLDPRYVGHTVKLSPLIVFLSMLVWGILWGPVGMILAVPMTVSIKVICARIPALEGVAILMKG
ncbi:AI-2E family transporter [Myxococcota bacterium]|nr:AI-2E family transporter [Myxococcota bacterium]MBU1433000.1 AI-2E family transporter [Myxococcota bacterium]MBU1897565.1 AI-2E family transporter [Myxococcota bacterium]